LQVEIIMTIRVALAGLAAVAAALLPAIAFAQSVSVTRSVLTHQPYTLIYPDPMVAAGGGPDPLTINHPDAPLQCDLTVVAVDDSEWTAEAALASLNDGDIVAGWSETFPGFAIGTKATTQYQNATALIYDGTSTGSPQGVPLTLVHTETVAGGNGYALDCLFATEVAAQARPIVDFIIANFSTRADAECCIGVTVDEPELPPAQ
jgi:hypothetical protein